MSIDLNRPPDDANLYPGRDTTGLCPVDTFDKEPLYKPGREPSREQIDARRALYWQPYHDALAQRTRRAAAKHGRVLLWEAHSIRSVVPRFFDGRLTDFNFGTADGAIGGAGAGRAARARSSSSDGRYSTVANGRFKGGYITRRYGQPAERRSRDATGADADQLHGRNAAVRLRRGQATGTATAARTRDAALTTQAREWRVHGDWLAHA